MHKQKAIAITQGDSAGIGPEIIAKAFRDQPARLRGCFVVGDVATLRRGAQAIFASGDAHLPVAQLESVQEVWDVPACCIPVWQLPHSLGG
jgi:4-hydroxythreonine-4-phosphate dehydrogenase